MSNGSQSFEVHQEEFTPVRNRLPKTPAKSLGEALARGGLTPRNTNVKNLGTPGKLGLGGKLRPSTAPQKERQQSIDFNLNDDFDEKLSLGESSNMQEKKKMAPKKLDFEETLDSKAEEDDSWKDYPDEVEECSYLWSIPNRARDIQDLIDDMPWNKPGFKPLIDDDDAFLGGGDYSLRGLLSEEELAIVERGENIYPDHMESDPQEVLKRLFFLPHGEGPAPDMFEGLTSGGLSADYDDGELELSDIEDASTEEESTFIDNTLEFSDDDD